MSVSGYYQGGYGYPANGYQYYHPPSQHQGHPHGHQQYHQQGQDNSHRSEQPDPSTSVYFKTKLCVKWKENNCRYGPRCKYAHGEHELRQLPPSVAETQRVPGQNNAPSVMLPANATDEQRAMLRDALRKTKMCERQMRTQDCPWGDRCNFAHSAEELKSVPANLQELINAAGHGGHPTRRPGTTKRPRAHQHADVAPPSSEALPTKASLSLADLQQRFEQLKREANRYAAETGHSVALFSVGAVLDASLEETAVEGEEVPEAVFVKEVEAGSNAALRCAVVKYGTGGVSKQLVARHEVVKFVGQQAAKAMAAAAAAAEVAAAAAAEAKENGDVPAADEEEAVDEKSEAAASPAKDAAPAAEVAAEGEKEDKEEGA